MKFPPTHTRTSKIDAFILELEALKKAFTYLRLPEKTITYLRRVSILKSSLYSARIEGNPLRPEDVSAATVTNPHSQHKQEVANIARAFSFLERFGNQPLTIEFFKELHRIVLDTLSVSAGLLRQEESAIFNQAGIAVYLTPAPQQIIRLLDELMVYCNSGHDHPTVAASVAHIWFEKIHPFDDGNGRVGRLLLHALLGRDGYDVGGVVPLEEYLDDHREVYYDALAHDTSDVTEFVEFFLDALVVQAKKTIMQATTPVPVHRVELLPRRAEILDVIRDHKMISFDGIARRFRAVSVSTLHFDLTYLMKKNYIKKLGSTRGAVYVPKEETVGA